jgi:hypothetical protein
VIPVKKNATGKEKTGIRRIPAGNTNPTRLGRAGWLVAAGEDDKCGRRGGGRGGGIKC